MSKQFIHIGISFADLVGEPEAFEKKLNSAPDWMRYAPNCWIVYTSRTPAQWYARLKPLLKDGDHIFIVTIDLSERQGWLPSWCWDWIKKKRD
jgi:hypothetical protein